VDRIERPSRTSLTFDAPFTELIPGIPEGAVAGACWTGRSSSREIVGCPSSDVPARVHSPRACARVRTTVCRPQFSFRPCGISPLRRFSPQHRIRACCIPVPDMGFAGFPWSPSSPPEDDSDEVYIPTSATPFEGLLLVGSRTPSLGPAPFLTVRTRSDGNRRPTDEPAWTNGGNSPCVSRSDRACATGDGGAFPPFRHHAQASFA
jgi:hypothetical protein